MAGLCDVDTTHRGGVGYSLSGFEATSTRVSVVIPTFNGSEFIAETLGSVCDELCDGDELIIVDDCSSDDTCDIAQNYLQQSCVTHWSLLVTPKNQGPPSARNVGIRSASGEVIMSVDQDDHWVTGHRQALVEALSTSDMASGRAHFELADGADASSGTRWWRDRWLEEPQQLCEFGASAIWRRCFEQIGLLDESFRFGGDDVEWFARAQSAGLTRREISEVVLARRIHNNNLSGRPELRQELLDVVRHHLKRNG